MCISRGALEMRLVTVKVKSVPSRWCAFTTEAILCTQKVVIVPCCFCTWWFSGLCKCDWHPALFCIEAQLYLACVGMNKAIINHASPCNC